MLAAIAAAAKAAGVDLRCAAPVERITVKDGRAAGVVLANGDEIAAAAVVSAINPRTTFIDLVGPRELDTGFVRKLGHVRMAGNVAKLNLALDRPPDFAGVAQPDLAGRLVIAPRPTMLSARSIRPSTASSRPSR